MDRNDRLLQQWEGTANGEALAEIRRLHDALGDQSAQDQEGARVRIEDLVRTLRQGGVYGKYDPHTGQFVPETARKQPPRKGRRA